MAEPVFGTLRELEFTNVLTPHDRKLKNGVRQLHKNSTDPVLAKNGDGTLKSDRRGVFIFEPRSIILWSSFNFGASDMNSEIDYGEVRQRIERMIGAERPFAWAKRIGISSATFNRFWNDGKPLKASTFKEIALAAGVSVDWLLTGQEPASSAPRPPPPRPVAASAMDDELMGRITDAIARLHEEEHRPLPALDLGRLAARRYAQITAATDDAVERLAMIKLVIVELRDELRAAIGGHG